MRRELVESRVLAAVRFLDAPTGVRVATTLEVRAAGVVCVRNRQGHYVMLDADEPAPANLEIEVRDPGRRYLPRRCTVHLPRDSDPAHAASSESLFRLIDVPLFLAPAALTTPGWAVVRATTLNAQTKQPLPGALIRVVRPSDSTLLASGLSDDRGEALVGVPGIPVTTWDEGPGPVLVTEVPVILEVVFDAAASKIPNPDDLEARRATLPASQTPVMLASGRELVTTLSVTLP